MEKKFGIYFHFLVFQIKFGMKSIFKRVYAVEGNIGAGKSTFLRLLKKNIRNVCILPESVTQWKNINGNDLLEAFYKDPKRWCFTFEIYTMYTLIKNLNEAMTSNTDIIFIERSILSNRIFHYVSESTGKLNSLEMGVLKDLYDYFKSVFPKLDGIIYIDTDVSTCLKRIKERGREEENGINGEYLKKLETEFIEINYNCPVLCIDGKYDQNDAKLMLEEVMKFVLSNN